MFKFPASTPISGKAWRTIALMLSVTILVLALTLGNHWLSWTALGLQALLTLALMFTGVSDQGQKHDL